MHKYFSLTYLSYDKTKLVKGEYQKIKAIKDGLCFRCGANVYLDHCDNCTEFGVLKDTDYLYNLDTKVINQEYQKVDNSLTFTDLQLKCANTMIDNYKLNKSMLIWAVCGAGKTEITFPVIEQALINKQNVCFAIPRIDILYDVYERLKWYFPKVEIAILNSKEKKYQDAQIYVMTTNQILNFKNAFGICIVDEVDAYPYEHNQKYDFAVNQSLISGGSIFYLTSTPSDIMLKRDVSHFIINRRWHGYDLPVPNVSYLNLKTINYSLKLRHVVKTYKRQQLWFVSNINFGLQILKTYQGCYNKQFDFVHASDENRLEKVNKFKQKQIDILITTTILERGVTFDDVDVFVLDSSSRMYNKAALIQIAGRVGRKKDYQDGRVVFFHQQVTKTMEEAIKEIRRMNDS